MKSQVTMDEPSRNHFVQLRQLWWRTVVPRWVAHGLAGLALWGVAYHFLGYHAWLGLAGLWLLTHLVDLLLQRQEALLRHLAMALLEWPLGVLGACVEVFVALWRRKPVLPILSGVGIQRIQPNPSKGVLYEIAMSNGDVYSITDEPEYPEYPTIRARGRRGEGWGVKGTLGVVVGFIGRLEPGP